MLTIAVSQRVVTNDEHGERRDTLDQAWVELLGARGWTVVPVPNRLGDPGRFLTELSIDGVLLSGGNDLAAAPGGSDVAPERDALERRLLDECAARDLPLFGVCRGLQHLVVHHGGRLSEVDRHIREPHPIRAREGVLPLCDRPSVNTFHRFGVREEDVPPTLRVAAVASDGSVEAVAHASLRQWAIMWHPERAPRDPRDLELMGALFDGRAGA